MSGLYYEDICCGGYQYSFFLKFGAADGSIKGKTDICDSEDAIIDGQENQVEKELE